MTRDYAVAQGPDGRLVLHTALCPIVRAQASRGVPVMTLFQCEASPSEMDAQQHDCLRDPRG